MPLTIVPGPSFRFMLEGQCVVELLCDPGRVAGVGGVLGKRPVPLQSFQALPTHGVWVSRSDPKGPKPRKKYFDGRYYLDKTPTYRKRFGIIETREVGSWKYTSTSGGDWRKHCDPRSTWLPENDGGFSTKSGVTGTNLTSITGFRRMKEGDGGGRSKTKDQTD